MKLPNPEVAKQIRALAERLQACENIEDRNQIEDELRALQMVLAYRMTVSPPDGDPSVNRAAA